MKVARVLGSSAAAAVFVLVPQAAFASDGYGAPGAGSGNQVSSPSTTAADTGALPSTGSSALDTTIAGAGLLLLLGGGAVVVASRRKQLDTA